MFMEINRVVKSLNKSLEYGQGVYNNEYDRSCAQRSDGAQDPCKVRVITF